MVIIHMNDLLSVSFLKSFCRFIQSGEELTRGSRLWSPRAFCRPRTAKGSWSALGACR